MTSHLFRFAQVKPQNVSEGGFRIKATKSNFPALQGMSLYKLILHSRAVREPHWHANADELGYCRKGKILVSFYGNRNMKESFLISAGEAFLIPSGFLHTLENVGEETAELILEFSNEEPEDFGISAAFGMFTDAVLGNTWGVAGQHFHSVKRSTKEIFIAKMASPSHIAKESHYTSPYRFALQASSPTVLTEVGNARLARKNLWPVLQSQALYHLQLTGKGMREPHWHPETAELGYVESGKGRMSILSPSGKVDTYEMEEGDIYFIPKAYPHHIENLGKSDLLILIFFDQPMPGDVGFTASVRSNSDEALSAVLNCPKEVVGKLPVYYENLFFVNKVNP